MQCVVFDMDGVLFDSEALVLRRREQTAEIHGIPDVREVCLRCLGTNAAESRRLFLEKYGADFPMTPIRRRCLRDTGKMSAKASWN